MLKLDDRNARLKLWSWTLSSTYKIKHNNLTSFNTHNLRFSVYCVSVYIEPGNETLILKTFYLLAVGATIDVDKNRILVL